MTSRLDTDSERYRKLSNQLHELEEKLMNTLNLEQFRIYHELQVCRFQIDAVECARISAVKQEILNAIKADCGKK
ncbi:hypothetical protein [Acetivibrio sp. MSJd-27]|jgi:hypothetical protein|uniref:hypothetical protein n=1 Tax=Acetivibrio sp. MSJd-27 TaxID=2841523 RepID=UPI001C121C84|nr:hypothetical protein [Acetivibrio sp. MSJd-27]MBU5450469.1 hypothetical protein [Acetivibrio sp. MSJd-27]